MTGVQTCALPISVDSVDGDGEADTGAGAAGGIDRGVDADEPARAIEQRPARITGIDRRVGLNHALNRSARHRFDLAVKRADDPGRQSLIETERVADGKHVLADLQVL